MAIDLRIYFIFGFFLVLIWVHAQTVSALILCKCNAKRVSPWQMSGPSFGLPTHKKNARLQAYCLVGVLKSGRRVCNFADAHSIKDSSLSVGSVGWRCVMPGLITSRVRGQTGSSKAVMHSTCLERLQRRRAVYYWPNHTRRRVIYVNCNWNWNIKIGVG